jgi:putative flippase GtrA
MLQKLYRIPFFRRLFSHIPPGELLGFLLVGIWNTGFGYATFVGFTILLSRRFPRYGYIPAGLLSGIVNISVAFLGYKWFIFKTRGNYLREWIRCMTVYGSSMLLGLVLLPTAVFLVRHLTPIQAKAPYVAAALLTGFNVIYNFLGNKKFSFRAGVPAEPATPPPTSML